MNNAVCPICLDPLTQNSQIICLRNHKLCTHCIDSLFASNYVFVSCPECRQPLTLSRDRIKAATDRKPKGTNVRNQEELPSQMFISNAVHPVVRSAREGRPVPVEYVCECKPTIGRLFLVTLVWVSFGLNCYYFIRADTPIVICYVLYAALLQLAVNWSDSISTQKQTSFQRTKTLLKQVCFFPLLLTPNNWLLSLNCLKQLALIGLVIQHQVSTKQYMNVLAIIVLSLNLLMVILNFLTAIIDQTVILWAAFMEERQMLKGFLNAVLVVCGYGTVVVLLWCMVTNEECFGLAVMYAVVTGMAAVGVMGHYGAATTTLKKVGLWLAMPYHVAFWMVSRKKTVVVFGCFLMAAKYLAVPIVVMIYQEKVVDLLAAILVMLSLLVEIPLGASIIAY